MRPFQHKLTKRLFQKTHKKGIREKRYFFPSLNEDTSCRISSGRRRKFKKFPRSRRVKLLFVGRKKIEGKPWQWRCCNTVYAVEVSPYEFFDLTQVEIEHT